MIGKAEWFTRRKYSGWGLTPKTWQGWVYVIMIILPFAIFNMFTWDNKTRIIVTLAWLGLVFADVMHIMFTLKKDEREIKIEALAERNATYVMVAILTIGVGYEMAVSIIRHQITIDPFIIIALVAGLIAKSATNLYYERKGI